MTFVPRRWRDRLGVRAHTTIAATLVVGFALVVGGVALGAVLRRSLVSNIDQVAELHSADIAEIAHQGRLGHTIAADEDEVVQVLGSDAQVVAASANVAGRPAIAPLQPAGEATATATATATIAIKGVAGKFRLVARRTASPAGPRWVFVATNLKPADTTLVLLRSSLFVGVPLLLAVVAAATWTTVGRALGPVEAIRSKVAEISQQDLGRRVPVKDANDEISRLARTMNDMLDRLQATVERQRRFVADASHELRTPLAASRADLEVALAHLDATNWLGTTQALLAENRRMQCLISDLLFIARSDDDAPFPPPAPVDLHEVLFGELDLLSAPGQVRIDTAAVHSAFVRGRRDDLARAVRNLLDNAGRHAETTITVGLTTLGDTVTLSIQDDGPGVPAEHRQRIFDRFARLDDARSRRTGGTGLGLAIVKATVERHQGTVTVEPAHPRGACFRICLPAD